MKIDVFKVSGHHFYHEKPITKRTGKSKAFWIGFSMILEAFGRLWAYFCPPFVRLLGGRISKRKKRGLCPDWGRIWDAIWSRIAIHDAGRRNTLPGFRAFCPAKARPCLAKRFNTAGPPARRGTPDLARRAGSSGVPLFENSARKRD